MWFRVPTVALCLTLVLAAVSCQSSQKPNRQAAAAQSWDPQLVETVFRYQISRSGTDYLAIRRTVYLSILGTDAPQSLMDQFMGTDIRVYKGSEFKVGKGVRHQIDRIQQVDSDHLIVEASWYQNDATSMAFKYQINRIDGRWKIVQDTVTRAT